MTDTATGLDDFRALLKLQELDTEIDQIRFRRAHLPEHETMAAISTRATALRPKLTAATVARDAIAERQIEIESEVEAVEFRISALNKRMYDGSLNLAPSDALAMSQEVKHLSERRSALEDRELAVMEELEPAQGEFDRLEHEAQEMAREMQSAQKVIAGAQKEMDATLDGLGKSRDDAAKAIPAALMTEYEMLRKKLGGQAAAPLLGTSCGGCHLALSATEVDNLRKAPATEVIHCEECGRILVR